LRKWCWRRSSKGYQLCFETFCSLHKTCNNLELIQLLLQATSKLLETFHMRTTISKAPMDSAGAHPQASSTVKSTSQHDDTRFSLWIHHLVEYASRWELHWRL
jgi:hypothetical protein